MGRSWEIQWELMGICTRTFICSTIFGYVKFKVRFNKQWFAMTGIQVAKFQKHNLVEEHVDEGYGIYLPYMLFCS
jgi:hypothetical protein